LVDCIQKLLLTNLRYAPVACPRCRRHAAIYDLKYPHRIAPPSKNPREYHFDIQDAKEYVLLKDGRRKIANYGEVIDIKPFLLSDEDRGSKRKHTWTAGLERDDTPGPLKERVHSETASTPQLNSFSNKRKKLNQPKSASPERQMSVSSENRPTVGPQLSEYETMQLLIANAAKEATGTGQPTTRLRRTVSTTPSTKKNSTAKSKPVKKYQPRPKHSVVVSVTQRRRQDIIEETEETVEVIQPILTSPKVTIYDEWQELVKKAQEDSEEGMARSRRTARRPYSVDDGAFKSSRKRPRNDDSDAQHSGEVTTNVAEVAPKCTSDEQNTNTVHPLRTNPAEDAFEQVKEEIPSPKIRRNVASLMADEIHKVKLEMACAAHVQFPSSTLPSPPYQRDKPSSLARNKEFLRAEVKRMACQRQSQSQKLPETTVLEGNRLFMFAILATEGLNE